MIGSLLGPSPPFGTLAIMSRTVSGLAVENFPQLPLVSLGRTDVERRNIGDSSRTTSPSAACEA